MARKINGKVAILHNARMRSPNDPGSVGTSYCRPPGLVGRDTPCAPDLANPNASVDYGGRLQRPAGRGLPALPARAGGRTTYKNNFPKF